MAKPKAKSVGVEESGMVRLSLRNLIRIRDLSRRGGHKMIWTADRLVEIGLHAVDQNAGRIPEETESK